MNRIKCMYLCRGSEDSRARRANGRSHASCIVEYSKEIFEEKNFYYQENRN